MANSSRGPATRSEGCVPRRAVHVARPIFFLLLILLAQLVAAAVPVVAQEAAVREAGAVVGTTGLNIRECPDVSCGSRGLAQLLDPIIVTGPEEGGYLPVEWAGKSGWAWHLYVATPSRGTPFLEQGTPGCKRVAFIFNIGIGEPLQIHPLLWLKAEGVPATLFPMGWWALTSRMTCGRSRCSDSRSAPMAMFGSI